MIDDVRTRGNRRIIIHCGSSKNGSTTLQNALLHQVEELAACGISVLRLSCVVKSQFKDELSSDECDIIWQPVPAIDLKGRDYTTSFGKLYEVYKIYRERRDVRALRALGDRIFDTLNASFQTYDTLIVTAEAFETSLCMRDGFFRRLIRRVAYLAQVDLVYYEPDPARHAISSWQQWAFIEKFPYSAWLDTYIDEMPAQRFFSSRGKHYFANLINVASWVDYWSNEKRSSLHHFQNIKDVYAHFHEHFLPGFDLPAKMELSTLEQNLGWPKSHLRSLPLFYEFLSGDYDKYEVLKALLIAKATKTGEESTAFYAELLSLTRQFMKAGESIDVSVVRDEIRLQIDHLFAEIPSGEAVKVCTYLADTVYFFHLEAIRSGEMPRQSQRKLPRISGRTKRKRTSQSQK